METQKTKKKVAAGPNPYFLRALSDADYALLCATRFCSPDMNKYHDSVCEALNLVRQAAAGYVKSFEKKEDGKADK